MNGNTGLPVRVDMLDPQATQFDFRGLPYQPPFVLPVQIATPQLQQVAPFITGACVMEVLNMASKNNLRVFHANMLCQYGWQTREFAEMVQQAAFIAEFFMHTKGMQPQQAVPAAATEAAIVSLGILASQYQQGLAPLITSPQVANALNEAVQRGHQWQGELQRFHNTLGAQMGGGPSMPINQYGQGGGPQYGGNAPYLGGNVGGGYPGVSRGPAVGVGRGAYSQFGNRGVDPAVVGSVRGGGGTGMFDYNAAPSGGGGSGSRMGMGMKPAKRKGGNNQNNTMLTMGADGSRTVEAWNSGDAQVRVEVESAQRRPAGVGGPFQFKGPGEQMDRMPETAPTRVTAPAARTQPRNLAARAAANAGFPRQIDPDDIKAGVELADGSIVKMAEDSDWTVTLDPTSYPYRQAYNTETHQLIHVKRPDGTVIEKLEPRTDNMEYEKHELNPTLRKQARERAEANGPNIPGPNWKQVNAVKPVRGSFGGLAAKAAAKVAEGADEAAPVDTSNDLVTPEPFKLDVVSTTLSLKEAQLKLAMFVKGKDVEAGTPVEFQFDVLTPIATKDDLVEALNQMETAGSFEELIQQLGELAELVDGRDGEYEEVFTTIDTRLTDAINQTLQQNFSLSDWSIDSFHEDYVDLLGALEEKFGGELVDRFVTHAPLMIGTALSVLKEEGLAAYLKSIDDDGSSSILAFRDRCSITQVPWKFEDLHLDLNGGGQVSEAAMPELHEALSAIFTRTEDFPVTFAHRYLQTADKQLIELRKGYLGTDALLVFPVNA